MSIRKYINSMRRRWNFTAIKRLRERLKPGPFSSPFLGLGTRLGNKMLTSAKHVMYCTAWQWIGYNLWRARIWLVTWSFCHGEKLMFGVWPDLSSLCEGCCLQDCEYLTFPHTHAHKHIIMLMGLFKFNHMISLVPRLMPPYARAYTSLEMRLSYETQL